MDQNNQNKTWFSSVISLRKVLSDKNVLQIIHPDAVWVASFIWNQPLEKDTVNRTKDLIGIYLPEDLVEFWIRISDGATFYYDQRYGQWGYRIYSSSEIPNQQSRWKNLFGDLWRTNFLAIGEVIDESHPIIAIINGNPKDKASYKLFEGNALDPIDYWVKIAASLQEWLDRMITAQGAKYWDWK